MGVTHGKKFPAKCPIYRAESYSLSFMCKIIRKLLSVEKPVIVLFLLTAHPSECAVLLNNLVVSCLWSFGQ